MSNSSRWLSGVFGIGITGRIWDERFPRLCNSSFQLCSVKSLRTHGSSCLYFSTLLTRWLRGKRLLVLGRKLRGDGFLGAALAFLHKCGHECGIPPINTDPMELVACHSCVGSVMARLIWWWLCASSSFGRICWLQVAYLASQIYTTARRLRLAYAQLTSHFSRNKVERKSLTLLLPGICC